MTQLFNRYVDLMKIFPRSKSELSFTFNDAVRFLHRRHGHRLTMFQPELINAHKLEEYADAIRRKGAPLAKCFGFLDGTVRPICRPMLGQREVTVSWMNNGCIFNFTT